MYPLVYFSNLISRVLKTKLLSFYSNSGHYLCISYSIYLYICIHTHTHTNGYICWYMIFIYIYMGMLKPKLQHFGHLTDKPIHQKRPWCWEEKGSTEDKMAGWHHQLHGHESEQALGVTDREALSAAVHGVAKSWTGLTRLTGLSDWTTTMGKIHVLQHIY